MRTVCSRGARQPSLIERESVGRWRRELERRALRCDGSSKFIFDLMEPERPKVDRAVLDFVKGHVFDPADFVIRSDGACRLNPEMARMVVAAILRH
jgi:hypothetical protein